IRGVDPVDSVAFRVQFTAALDPRRPLDTAAVRVFALPDTTPVAVRALFTSAQYDSLQAKARAAADSVRRARDTTARRDTLRARGRCRRRHRRAHRPRAAARPRPPGHHPRAARLHQAAMSDPRRRLPAVEALLAERDIAALLATHPRSLVLRAVRETIDAARADGGTVPLEGWGAAVRARAYRLAAPSLGPVINAT